MGNTGTLSLINFFFVKKFLSFHNFLKNFLWEDSRIKKNQFINLKQYYNIQGVTKIMLIFFYNFGILLH